MKVVHVITRLILGGAQENTLLTVDDQHHLWKDDVVLVTGPAIGPEGSLFERARQRRLDLRIIPELRREIHLWRDWQSYRHMVRLLGEFGPDIVHTHSSKAGILGRVAAHRLNFAFSLRSQLRSFNDHPNSNVAHSFTLHIGICKKRAKKEPPSGGSRVDREASNRAAGRPLKDPANQI